MNSSKVIDELRIAYPGKEIIEDYSDDPKEFAEIIVEIEPSSQHPEKSLALAVVGKSRPHYHQNSTEIYEAQKGNLTVYVDGVKHVLQPGEKLTVKPGKVHYAEGVEAWFLTYSSPGWTEEDHIVV